MNLGRFIFISGLVHVSFWGAFLFVQSRQEKVLDLTDIILLEGQSTSSTVPSNAIPKVPAKVPSANPTVPVASNEIAQNPATEQQLSSESSASNTDSKNGQLPSLESYGGTVHSDYGSLTRLPRIKNEVKAEYPLQAKEAGISGAVVLEVIIGRDGFVKAAKIIRGPGYGLEEAALKAIARFEFQPAFKDKEPVAVRIQYTYRFKLDIN